MFIRRIFAIVAISCGAAVMYSETALAHSPHDRDRVYPVIADARAMHAFIYYPQAQVYYSPQRRVWYWFDGRRWQNNYTLPIEFRVDFRLGGVPINLRSALPFREHHYIDSYYGRPWRARYYRPDEGRERHYHASPRQQEQEVWRETGRGYPRRDYDRNRYQDQDGHHRW